MIKLLVVAVVVLIIYGCGPKGPSVTVCTPRAADQKFVCYNQNNKKQSIATPVSVDNWLFVSAADERSILTACQKSTGWPKVKVCSFSAGEMKFVCFNDLDGTMSSIAFQDANGFIGVSSVDMQILLEFCEARAAAKK